MLRIVSVLAILAMLFIGCDKNEERTSLLGYWNCEEFPEQTLPRTYSVGILRNPYISGVTNEYMINNFYSMGNSEAAQVYFYQDTISGDLIIKPQIIMDNSIYGLGTVNEDFSKIDWVYYVSSGSVNEKVVAYYY